MASNMHVTTIGSILHVFQGNSSLPFFLFSCPDASSSVDDDLQHVARQQHKWRIESKQQRSGRKLSHNLTPYRIRPQAHVYVYISCQFIRRRWRIGWRRTRHSHTANYELRTAGCTCPPTKTPNRIKRNGPIYSQCKRSAVGGWLELNAAHKSG